MTISTTMVRYMVKDFSLNSKCKVQKNLGEVNREGTAHYALQSRKLYAILDDTISCSIAPPPQLLLHN